MLIPLDSIKNKWPRKNEKVERMVKALQKSSSTLPICVYDKGSAGYAIDPYHAVLFEAYKTIFKANPKHAVECQVIVDDD